MKLYTIVFHDRTTFEGGDSYFNTKWTDIPDKDISTLFYYLPSGESLCFTHFKRIYCFIDGAMDIMGAEKGKIKPEYIHIFVERNCIVVHYTINIRYKNINVEEMDINNPVINQLNPIGWKYGKNK